MPKRRQQPSNVKVAKIDPNCAWMPSRDLAAAAALLRVPTDSPNEFAGAIYQNDKGEFCYSVPVEGELEEFAFATDPGAGRLAGIYHTHPYSSEPSKHDMDVAKRLNVPSYIRSMKLHNQFHVFNPRSNSRGARLARALIDAARKSAEGSEDGARGSQANR